MYATKLQSLSSHFQVVGHCLPSPTTHPVRNNKVSVSPSFLPPTIMMGNAAVLETKDRKTATKATRFLASLSVNLKKGSSKPRDHARARQEVRGGRRRKEGRELSASSGQSLPTWMLSLMTTMGHWLATVLAVGVCWCICVLVED